MTHKHSISYTHTYVYVTDEEKTQGVISLIIVYTVVKIYAQVTELEEKRKKKHIVL